MRRGWVGRRGAATAGASVGKRDAPTCAGDVRVCSDAVPAHVGYIPVASGAPLLSTVKSE